MHTHQHATTCRCEENLSALDLIPTRNVSLRKTRQEILSAGFNQPLLKSCLFCARGGCLGIVRITFRAGVTSHLPDCPSRRTRSPGTLPHAQSSPQCLRAEHCRFAMAPENWGCAGRFADTHACSTSLSCSRSCMQC